MNGPAEKGISFELPRNSLIEACKYNIFDDLLIGNFMKTKLHNLKNLYDPEINFNEIVCKYGDNGLAYSKNDLLAYEKEYAKRMGIEYFYDLFANQSKNYFQFFFKNELNFITHTKMNKSNHQRILKKLCTESQCCHWQMHLMRKICLILKKEF